MDEISTYSVMLKGKESNISSCNINAKSITDNEVVLEDVDELIINDSLRSSINNIATNNNRISEPSLNASELSFLQKNVMHANDTHESEQCHYANNISVEDKPAYISRNCFTSKEYNASIQNSSNPSDSGHNFLQK